MTASGHPSPMPPTRAKIEVHIDFQLKKALAQHAEAGGLDDQSQVVELGYAIWKAGGTFEDLVDIVGDSRLPIEAWSKFSANPCFKTVSMRSIFDPQSRDCGRPESDIGQPSHDEVEPLDLVRWARQYLPDAYFSAHGLRSPGSWDDDYGFARWTLEDALNIFVKVCNQPAFRLIFVPGIGWYSYGNGVWTKSRRLEEPLARMTQVRSELGRRRIPEGDEEKKKLKTRFLQRFDNGKLKLDIIDMVEKRGDLSRNAELLDQQNVLAYADGSCIDLGSLVARKLVPDDLVTKYLNVERDDAAEAPKWKQFIETFFPDSEIRDFIHRALGYTLLPTRNEQVFFFLHGEGSNGKSTLLNVISKILEEFVGNLSRDELTGKQSPEQTLALLPGKRLILGAEIQKGDQLNESFLKGLAGGDRMTGRFLYKDAFDFYSSGKIWLFGNDLPSVVDTSHGIWRRMRVIPMTVMLAQSKQIQNYEEVLLTESPGIVEWLLEGAKEYLSRGLQMPEMMMREMATYREEENQLNDFFESILGTNVEEDEHGKMPSKQLYKVYTDFKTEYRERNVYGYKLFLKELAKLKKYQVARDASTNKNFVYGLSFLNPYHAS